MKSLQKPRGNDSKPTSGSFGGFRDLRWNVFEDSSAFRTYFNLFTAFILLLAVQLVIKGEISRAGAFLVCSTCSLLPLGLWSYGKLKGLPIFPAYGLTFFATFALQIYLQEQLYDTRRYFMPDSADPWWATLAVGLFVLPGAWLAFALTSRIPPPSQTCSMVNRSFANQLMFIMFISSSLVTAGLATEKFSFLGNVGSILSAAARTGSIVSLFVLAFQIGQGKLSRSQGGVVGVFLLLSIIASIASLFLGGAISMLAVGIAGFSLGKRKVPWIWLIMLLPLFSVLHAGKNDMRAKYWGEARAVNTVGFLDYPSFFLEWFDYGLKDIQKDKESQRLEAATDQSLLERSSLIEIFITAKKRAPQQVDFLGGETYKHIPLMLLPRFIYPDKPVVHEGQRLMNIHFGIQSAEAVETTYIAWGLLNEAFANFGFWGLPVAGLVIAAFFSYVTRLCSGIPILSFRGLIGALTLGFAIQAEMAAAVWLTSYIQSILLLLALRWVLMEKLPNPEWAPEQPTANQPRSKYYRMRSR